MLCSLRKNKAPPKRLSKGEGALYLHSHEPCLVWLAFALVFALSERLLQRRPNTKTNTKWGQMNPSHKQGAIELTIRAKLT